ncbi:MAG: peptidase U32 [Deltaproteobacteria bacterium HGW-Deltaproteobacteria-13]|jgi:putative protease|nr:MAG: peptidase U32 [Deltaproteobacteria bacterium HGW-Deltaproteobacteria-13]
MRKPELLIPAGNLEKLRTALLYGADAVYVGVAGLSLRAGSAEMSMADLAAGVNEAHAKGVKVYAAANTFARNTDLELAKKIIPELAAIGIDALIISEPGMLRLIRNSAPQLPVHLSTQANTTNIEAVRFWHDQGVKRIVLARELNLKEVGEIATAVPEMELEIFIHGAMCMAYSGRCYLSAFRNRRSANEGDCSQPCRWEYLLHESTRPDDPLILREDDRYSYLLSSKDLCLIECLPDVLASGVTSLKIEGRMKSTYYVAVVTRTYRQALDALTQQKEKYKCRQEWIDELTKISNRGYTTGFAFAEEKINETSQDVKYIQTHEPAGTVLQYNAAQKRILLGVRNRLQTGGYLELLLPDGIATLTITEMTDKNGNELSEAHSGNEIYLPFDRQIPVGILARQTVKSGGNNPE